MSSGAAIFVMGPAGSGKSTCCAALIEQCESMGRVAHLINLDPAADNFAYTPSKDICELISVEDVMDELQYGPNGALVFCLEYLLENVEWLADDLGQYHDEFLIIDCPGQIELYTHYDIMARIIAIFQQADYKVCAIYLLESLFLQEVSKFFAGVLTATSAMLSLGIPHLNVISKMDLLHKHRPSSSEDHLDEEAIEEDFYGLAPYFSPDPALLEGDLLERINPRLFHLTHAIVQLLNEFNLVSFIPLNVSKAASLEKLMMHIENATQYSEALEPKEPKDEEGDLDDV